MVRRITNSIIQRQVTNNLQTNLKRLSQLQQQLSSAKRFSTPSDNPIGYSRALNLREILSSENRYVENIQRGTDYLSLNDSNLSSLNEIIQRAQEIALTGANDTLDDDARGSLALEVEELLNEAVQLGNSDSGGIYLYAGNSTDAAPFEFASENGVNFIRYIGDEGARNFEIGQGITMPVLLTGVETFLGESGKMTATARVNDPTGLLNAELAAEVPPVTSGDFTINGVTFTVDVTTDSLEDIRDQINAADADVVASIDDLGRLTLKSMRSIDAQLEDGTSNILQTLGFHSQLNGQALGAAGTITAATPLAGLGITPQALRITVDDQSVDIDLSSAVQVGDVLTAINNSGLPVNAYINTDGSGITVSATQTVDSLEIEDVSRVFGSAIGGPGIDSTTTLASLGIATPLSAIDITNGNETIEVDLSSATTVGEVLELINDSGAGVQAVVNSAGTGIDIINYTPMNDLTIAEVGAGTTAATLGILGSDTDSSAADLGLEGEGISDRVESNNIFKALTDLQNALTSRLNDQTLFDDALNELDAAFNLTNGNRATVGARMNRLELAENRFSESELFLTELISQNEDVDLAATITDLATQETVLQAALNSGARLLTPSLLDFLPL